MHTTDGILDYIHADLWGPARVVSHGDNRYFLSIVDDYSRKLWMLLLKTKNEAFDKFKAWKVMIENQTNRKIKRFRTNNGLEFCAKEFNNFCRNEGIARHKTIKDTPQQNDLAEWMNRTILERVRCMLCTARLPRQFWVEAVMTACHLISKCPSTTIGLKTP